MSRVVITPIHDEDKFDTELLQLRIKFREIGINDFPKDYIKIPSTNMDANAIIGLVNAIRNTWYKRNRSDDNLQILKDAYDVAKEEFENLDENISA